MTRSVLGALALSLSLFVSTDALARGGYSQSQDFRDATPEELAMKSVASDPGAEAAILDWVTIDDDKAGTSSTYFRIKVFTEEGKKHADVEIRYAPGYPLFMRVTDLEARTIRPDGTSVPFDGKVYDKVLVKVGRRAVRAKTFTFADVQPGSILEYRYIRRWTSNYLLDTHWTVQRSIPVVHSKFTLKPYDTKGQFGSYFTYYGIDKPPAKVPGGYELELTNVPAMRSEAYMPPEEQLLARVNFYYTDSRVRLEEFWNVQAGIFTNDIEKYLGRAGAANAIARELRAAHPEPQALLRAVYAHAQSLRNLSFEGEKTDQEIAREKLGEAKNADEVLSRRAGYAHEINRAFVALARAAGLEARVVRVAPRDEFFFSPQIPNAEQMSDEVAVVTVDGKRIWLDPGTPRAPFGILSWEKSNVPGIEIVKGAKSPVSVVPSHEPPDAVLRRKADLRLNDADALTGTISVAFTGQEALVRRLAALHDDEAARKKALEEEAKGWFPEGATLKVTSFAGYDSSDPELTATFEAVLPNIVSRAGSKVIVPISVFETTAKNPFAASKRTHPVYFPYPHSEEDEVKLAVPAGLTVATLPPPSDLAGGSVKYHAATSREGETIVFRRNTSVSTMMVDVPYYPALRKFFSARTAADQQPLVLVAQ